VARAREEAILAGTSSACKRRRRDSSVAIQMRALGPDAKVVTLMADSGLKYLSTDVYRRRGQFYRSWVTGSGPGYW
jgi:cysteine synthase A